MPPSRTTKRQALRRVAVRRAALQRRGVADPARRGRFQQRRADNPLDRGIVSVLPGVRVKVEQTDNMVNPGH